MTTLVRVSLLALIPLVASALLLAHGPIPQDQAYHQFAGDERARFGIPCADNVVSNVPFVLVGVLGLLFLGSVRGRNAFRDQVEMIPFSLFFLGILLTGFGSGYYHAGPTDARLVWDRLPIAFAFMALFAGVIGERLGTRVGLWALGPLLFAGVGSVLIWVITGDLRFYFLVQGVPLLVIPLLLAFWPAPYTHGSDYVGAILCYLCAKFLEWGDVAVYEALGGLVSGHVLKHLVSGVGAFVILWMLGRRRSIL